MRGKELLDKMELIDPVYLEAADTAPVRKAGKLKHIRWGVAAACLCVLLGTTGVMAATGLGTKLISFFSSREESGYEISAEIVKFPAGVLQGEIREVPAVIRQQFASYEPFMDYLPGSWERAFATRDDACDYVGFNRIKRMHWDPQEEQTLLYVQGTENGDLASVSVETRYTAGDIRLQFFSDIFTENTEEETTILTAMAEKTGFTETFRTSGSGKTIHVIEETAMESSYLSKDGYLVEEGILYHLHVAYLEKDAGRAEELLMQWADLF